MNQNWQHSPRRAGAAFFSAPVIFLDTFHTVSYTHLDVYKRQHLFLHTGTLPETPDPGYHCLGGRVQQILCKPPFQAVYGNHGGGLPDSDPDEEGKGTAEKMCIRDSFHTINILRLCLISYRTWPIFCSSI